MTVKHSAACKAAMQLAAMGQLMQENKAMQEHYQKKKVAAWKPPTVMAMAKPISNGLSLTGLSIKGVAPFEAIKMPAETYLVHNGQAGVLVSAEVKQWLEEFHELAFRMGSTVESVIMTTPQFLTLKDHGFIKFEDAEFATMNWPQHIVVKSPQCTMFGIPVEVRDE
jgi:hypothetical protein